MLTVLGASGFVGRHLCERLRVLGVDHFAPARDTPLAGRKLGDIIYCIGLTADFRTKPLDTVEAHVSALASLLRQADFDSLLYLSSTRPYHQTAHPFREDDALQVQPLVPEELYNISKVMGEALTLACGRNARIARLSNVYGDDFASENFLSSIIRDALTKGHVTFRTSPDSDRDYVAVTLVAESLIEIALRGKHQIYNLASGRNTSHRQLAERLQSLTGCSIEFLPGAPQLSSPVIAIDRMKQEFNYCGSDVMTDLEGVVNSYRRHLQI